MVSRWCSNLVIFLMYFQHVLLICNDISLLGFKKKKSKNYDKSNNKLKTI